MYPEGNKQKTGENIEKKKENCMIYTWKIDKKNNIGKKNNIRAYKYPKEKRPKFFFNKCMDPTQGQSQAQSQAQVQVQAQNQNQNQVQVQVQVQAQNQTQNQDKSQNQAQNQNQNQAQAQVQNQGKNQNQCLPKHCFLKQERIKDLEEEIAKNRLNQNNNNNSENSESNPFLMG